MPKHCTLHGSPTFALTYKYSSNSNNNNNGYNNNSNNGGKASHELVSYQNVPKPCFRLSFQ